MLLTSSTYTSQRASYNRVLFELANFIAYLEANPYPLPTVKGKELADVVTETNYSNGLTILTDIADCFLYRKSHITCDYFAMCDKFRAVIDSAKFITQGFPSTLFGDVFADKETITLLEAMEIFKELFSGLTNG